ncbi:ABC transporter permease [Butyrivibrio sp. VCD2006]|uniref:ABC transporter permease n=1 Tax=Butyrivibrio sp. VCD2006 TaxID=1280664 RepID=UPI00042899C3|nr:ABC transporter permease [Butyrivibrio sp. VCD2006]
MSNLYKANMRRILKNSIFVGGCVIAFVVTLAFTANLMGFTGRFEEMGPDRRMVFVSVAMLAFFTIFVPLYTNMEYRYGVIRNKILSGYSQKEVYFSHLFSHFTALAIMMLCYITGGIIGGARSPETLVISSLVLFFALCGYIATMMLVTMRIIKITLVSIFAFLILETSYVSVMVGNALMAFVLKGAAQDVGRIVYNCFAFGQWLVCTGLTDDVVKPGAFVQIVISVAVSAVMIGITTIGLNKRDLQ